MEICIFIRVRVNQSAIGQQDLEMSTVSAARKNIGYQKKKKKKKKEKEKKKERKKESSLPSPQSFSLHLLQDHKD